MIDENDQQKVSKTDIYEYNYKIGKGAYGTVYDGFSTQTQDKVAIKVINFDSRFEYDCSKVLREI